MRWSIFFYPYYEKKIQKKRKLHLAYLTYIFSLSSPTPIANMQAILCTLVMNELISNALKHAFKEGQKGTLEIPMKRSTEDTIFVRVKDDGIGIWEEIDIYKTESLGLKLVRNIVQKQLQGKLQVKRNKGTEFILEEEAKYV